MWLYVPGTSSPSVPASEVSNSASNLLSSVGERLAEASATWRGSAQQPRAWSRRWKRGGFIRLLSGVTCSPSTLDHGVALFISSLRETPAKRTASPGSGLEPLGSASSPPRSSALPPSAGLILSSARTCRGTQANNSMPSSHHWKGWATGLRQEFSARPDLATPCSESDCSSWPSAKTVTGQWERDRNGNVYPTLEGAAVNWRGPNAAAAMHGPMPPAYREARGQMVSLDDQAAHWMAPNVPNGGRSASHAEMVGATAYHNGKKVQIGLEHQTRKWPGPAARDSKGANSAAHLLVSTGSLHLGQLPNYVEHVFVLPLSLGHPKIAGGSMSSTAGPNSNQPSTKRKLNPIFVEALMRWPTGLSGFERQETAWTRWLHAQLSYLSALYSPKLADEQMSLL